MDFYIRKYYKIMPQTSKITIFAKTSIFNPITFKRICSYIICTRIPSAQKLRTIEIIRITYIQSYFIETE